MTLEKAFENTPLIFWKSQRAADRNNLTVNLVYALPSGVCLQKLLCILRYKTTKETYELFIDLFPTAGGLCHHREKRAEASARLYFMLSFWDYSFRRERPSGKGRSRIAAHVALPYALTTLCR